MSNHHRFHQASNLWNALVGAFTALCLIACQPIPAFGPGADVFARAMGVVKLNLQIPGKSGKAERRTLATGEVMSALLVNRVGVSLSGPGFMSELYPPGTVNGEMEVGSGALTSHIENVPSGSNRIVKVKAYNGQRKLSEIAGVLNVEPGPFNHVAVGLATTPTAQVIEKLGRLYPEVARNLDAAALQAYFDNHVTQPVKGDPARQNSFDGYHPYLVNTDGVVAAMIANGFAIPAGFDPARAADQTFVFQPARVNVETGALPVGSRIWLNDPTSDILVTNDPTATSYAIDNVAPAFEPAPGQPAANWNVTILTPDGRMATAEVAVSRLTLADPVRPVLPVDLASTVANAQSAITGLVLSPTDASFADPTVAIRGRVSKQIFAYARNGAGQLMPLVPGALDWESLDPTILTVGDGDALASDALVPLGAAASGLVGRSLHNAGLVYPLQETAPGVTARIKATLRGTALSEILGFTVGQLGADTSQAKLDVQVGGIAIVNPAVPGSTTTYQPTLSSRDHEVELAVLEGDAPADATYRWAINRPDFRLVNASGNRVKVRTNAHLPAGDWADLTVYSSSGRKASTRIYAAFGSGRVTGSAKVSLGVRFVPLPDTNAGNVAFTASAAFPLGGYINTALGQATIRAVEDEAPDGGRFFWSSSDSLVMAVSGSYPSQEATLTALRPGTATITARGVNGRSISIQLNSQFDGLGKITGSIKVRTEAIQLDGVTPDAIATALPTFGAETTVGATEQGIASPKFIWVSRNSSVVTIGPPVGETFPCAQAVFRSVGPGPVDFYLVSAETGQIKTFSMYIGNPPAPGGGGQPTFIQQGRLTGTLAVPALRVRQIAPVFVESGLTSVVKTLGDTVTLEAEDPTDPAGEFVWTTSSGRLAPIVNRAGRQVTIRLLDYGKATIQVFNARNSRWGVKVIDMQNTGRGTTTARVRL